MKARRKLLFLILLFLPAVTLPADTSDDPASRIGIHLHYQNYPNYLDVPWLSGFQFKRLRLWDTGTDWAMLEPQKGKWDFTILDQYAALSEKHGVELIMTLCFTPAWAAKNPKKVAPYGNPNITTSPPRDFKDWENMVETLGTRYKGKIRYWEIWNEPDNILHSYYSGTIAEMVELTKRASQILKKIDPENKIISPSITQVGYFWLSRYLALGGKDWIDMIGFHQYILNGMRPEQTIGFVKSLQYLAESYGIGKKPVWYTEGGPDYQSSPFSDDPLRMPEQKQISYLSRLILSSLVSGANGIWLYGFAIDRYTGLFDNQSMALTAKGKAVLLLMKWLSARSIRLYRFESGVHRIVLAGQSGDTAEILWTEGLPVRKNYPGWKKATLLTGEQSDPNNSKTVIGTIPVILEK